MAVVSRRAYGRGMKSPTLVLTGLVLLAAFTGCNSDNSGRRGRHDREGDGRNRATVVVYEDDYDYYPGYEVYYSRTRHEYVYRDGTQWVRRPQPRGVQLDVLLAAPSVRVDFRDSPERHHDSVIRTYPRNWKRQDDRKDRPPEARDNKEDRKDGRP